MSELFDDFVTSQDLSGVRMPNPEFIRHVLTRYPDVAQHEAFLVGDKIDRSLSAAKEAGIRTVLYANCSENRESNNKSLSHGLHPDFTIWEFT